MIPQKNSDIDLTIKEIRNLLNARQEALGVPQHLSKLGFHPHRPRPKIKDIADVAVREKVQAHKALKICRKKLSGLQNDGFFLEETDLKECIGFFKILGLENHNHLLGELTVK